MSMHSSECALIRSLARLQLRRAPISHCTQRRSIGVPARLRPHLDAIKAGTFNYDRNGKPLLPRKEITVHAPPPSSRTVCKDPVSAVSDSQIALHDPDGTRTRLISRGSPPKLQAGDIVIVHRRGEAPVSGHLIMIRNRGIDSSILLRNELTRVGVEMYIKVYSPLVEGIEVVQRWKKRARRARVTYLRKPEHNKGSTENVVTAHLKRRRDLAEGRLSSGIQITRGRRKVDSKKAGEGTK